MRWSTGWFALAAAACVLGWTQDASAWSEEGHAIVAQGAAASLPQDVPAFLRQAVRTLGEYSAQPDLWKTPATPHVRTAEGPEHFLNFESLAGNALPPNRWDYVVLCAKMGKNPRDVGLLPYAICEWTERLAVAFAEYRRNGETRDFQNLCLVYAGILSHYTADLSQPLHLTVDYDGRIAAKNPIPKTGIHNRMDWLIRASRIQPSEIAAGLTPAVMDDPLTSTMETIVETRRAVDTVYSLENELPLISKDRGLDPNWQPTARVREFALERARAACLLTASCWLSAWEKSKSIRLHSSSDKTAPRPRVKQPSVVKQ